MSNTQMVLYLLALLSIYALAAALDQQAEQSNPRQMAQVDVSRCTRAAWRRAAPLPAEVSASAVSSAC